MQTEFSTAVYLALAGIPAGRVITYGQLAQLSGYPNHARQVARLLAQLPDDTRLPWHRVITARGAIACPADSPTEQHQYQRLKNEGIDLANVRGIHVLRRYQWR